MLTYFWGIFYWVHRIIIVLWTQFIIFVKWFNVLNCYTIAEHALYTGICENSGHIILTALRWMNEEKIFLIHSLLKFLIFIFDRIFLNDVWNFQILHLLIQISIWTSLCLWLNMKVLFHFFIFIYCEQVFRLVLLFTWECLKWFVVGILEWLI